MASFAAMGTTVTVLAPALDARAEAALACAISEVFAASEQRFSRFLAESELSRLQRAEGPARVSRPLLDALVAARRWHACTGGLFDPAIGGPLVAHGYDRSFAPGALDRESAPRRPATARATFAEVVVDELTATVTLPAHVGLDLGGLVKGRTVDQAARLRSPGGQVVAALAVEAGGDAVLRGDGPEGRGWIVEVEDPRDAARTLCLLRVCDRALATSAPNRRRWRVGGETRHHLIDPRTAAPAESDLAQVTVIAEAAEAADVLAKTVFLLGRVAGRRWLSALPRVGAVLVGSDGAIETVGDVEVVDA